MSHSDLVLFETRGRVGLLTLNDPKRRNALSDGMIDQLLARLDEASRQRDLGCLVLTGAGGAFCAGGDVKDMRDRAGYAAGGPADIRDAMLSSFQRIPRAFFALDLPVVAAVAGPAIGAGCDIAAMCDMVVAADSASFAESFVRLGVLSGDGGAWFLMRAIGYQRTAEMTLTGDAINAHTAKEWGLVGSVVAEGDLLDEAMALAERIARHPQRTLRMAKRLLRETYLGSMHSSLELAATMQGVAFHTEDHREAVAAMFEKRAGQFNGK